METEDQKQFIEGFDTYLTKVSMIANMGYYNLNKAQVETLGKQLLEFMGAMKSKILEDWNNTKKACEVIEFLEAKLTETGADVEAISQEFADKNS